MTRCAIQFIFNRLVGQMLISIQRNSITRLGISAVALTFKTVREYPRVWSNVKNGRYSVVLASPEVLLSNGSVFWLRIARQKKSAFCCRLACIAVDEAHLIWGWRTFQKEYGNVGTLKIVFADVPIIVLSATFTRNVLEYICQSLHLRSPVHLYKRTLDRPNITYMVQKITKPGFGELDALLFQEKGIADMPKTMIFVDSINEGVGITMYLCSMLHGPMRESKDIIVRLLASNLRASTRVMFMDNFRLGNTRILVCTNAAGMGVDVRDVKCSIQYKITDHLLFAALVQQIGQAGQDPNVLTVSIVIVKPRNFFPEDVGLQLESLFREYTSAIGPLDCKRAEEIISTMYKAYLEPKKEKAPSGYYKVDPALLWFINTIGCCQYLALACFMSDSFFQSLTSTSCCDNCMYSHWNQGDTALPVFERHGITAQHCRQFLATDEHHWVSELEAINSVSCLEQNRTRTRTNMRVQDACSSALANFATAR